MTSDAEAIELAISLDKAHKDLKADLLVFLKAPAATDPNSSRAAAKTLAKRLASATQEAQTYHARACKNGNIARMRETWCDYQTLHSLQSHLQQKSKTSNEGR